MWQCIETLGQTQKETEKSQDEQTEHAKTV